MLFSDLGPYMSIEMVMSYGYITHVFSFGTEDCRNKRPKGRKPSAILVGFLVILEILIDKGG